MEEILIISWDEERSIHRNLPLMTSIIVTIEKRMKKKSGEN
jgi:hypothetical protein